MKESASAAGLVVHAGFYDFTQDNVNITFRATLSMFNKRLSTAKRETSRARTDGSCGHRALGYSFGKQNIDIASFFTDVHGGIN